MAEEQGRGEEDDKLEDIASLFGDSTFHHAIDQFSEGGKHLANVNESQEFEQVNGRILLHGNHWRHCCEHVENEVALDVALRNGAECAIIGRGDKEADADLDAPGNVIDPDEPE